MASQGHPIVRGGREVYRFGDHHRQALRRSLLHGLTLLDFARASRISVETVAPVVDQFVELDTLLRVGDRYRLTNLGLIDCMPSRVRDTLREFVASPTARLRESHNPALNRSPRSFFSLAQWGLVERRGGWAWLTRRGREVLAAMLDIEGGGGAEVAG